MMDGVITFGWNRGTFRITSWGADMLLLIVILVVVNAVWFVWRKQYRRALGIVASSTALLTWPLGMSFVDDVSPPWKLVAFLGYAMLELACAIAFRTWLTAGALAGLFSMVFMSDPSSSATVAGIIIVVVFGAFCGWLVELELNHRKSCPQENGQSSARPAPNKIHKHRPVDTWRGRSAMRPRLYFLGTVRGFRKGECPPPPGDNKPSNSNRQQSFKAPSG